MYLQIEFYDVLLGRNWFNFTASLKLQTAFLWTSAVYLPSTTAVKHTQNTKLTSVWVQSAEKRVSATAFDCKASQLRTEEFTSGQQSKREPCVNLRCRCGSASHNSCMWTCDLGRQMGYPCFFFQICRLCAEMQPLSLFSEETLFPTDEYLLWPLSDLDSFWCSRRLPSSSTVKSCTYATRKPNTVS